MNISKYLNLADQKYKRLNESRKKIISLVIFIFLFMLFSDILFFNSFNFYKTENKQYIDNSNKLEQLNSQLRTVNPSRSVIEQTQLLTRKTELEKEILELKNKGITQTKPEDVPGLINTLMNNFNNLSLVKINNSPQTETFNNIQKHIFQIEFNSTNYMNAFSFIKEIENLTQIESISIKIQNEKLNVHVKFFILNESKQLFIRNKS